MNLSISTLLALVVCYMAICANAWHWHFPIFWDHDTYTITIIGDGPVPAPETTSLSSSIFDTPQATLPGKSTVPVPASSTRPAPPRQPTSSAVSNPTTTGGGGGGGDGNEWMQDMLAQLNSVRQKAGRPPVKLDDRINAVAQSHTNYMASAHIMTHNDPAGSVDRRVSAAGVQWSGVGENVAEGYNTVSEVIQGWTGSPGHYANMVGDFNIVGFGKKEGGGVIYWTQEFVKAMN